MKKSPEMFVVKSYCHHAILGRVIFPLLFFLFLPFLFFQKWFHPTFLQKGRYIGKHPLIKSYVFFPTIMMETGQYHL